MKKNKKQENWKYTGATPKERNHFEVQWGILKILDAYKEFLDKKIKDFFVVFDDDCDIEVHKNNNDKNEIYYYEVKTHDKKNFTINELFDKKEKTKKQILIKENKEENSIVGKLYKLKMKNKKLVKLLAIVTNQILKYKDKKNSELIPIKLDNLFKNSDDKQKYIKKINEELNINYFKLSDIKHVYTELPLHEPEVNVIGKLVMFFNEIKKEELINPSSLYDTINSSAQKKSRTTKKINPDSSLKKEKSISKDEFESIIKIHLNNSKKSAQKIINFAKEKQATIQEIDEIRNELAIMKSNDFLLSTKIEETVDNLKEQIKSKFGYLRINDVTFEMIRTEILSKCNHFFDSNNHNEFCKIILIIRALIMIYEL